MISRGVRPEYCRRDGLVSVRGQDRQLFIEIVFGEINSGQPRHMGKIKIEMRRGFLDPSLFPGVGRLHILVHDRRDQKQHLDMIGIAAEFPGLRPVIVAKFFHRGDASRRRDHGFRPPRRERSAARGTSGLANDRMSLW